MSDYIAIIGLVVAIVGIPIAIFAAKHYSSRASIKFHLEREKIFDSAESSIPTSLSIAYQGNEIANLYRWDVVFWNDGNHVFDADHFLDKDLLRVSFEKHDVVDVQEGPASREIVGAQLSKLNDNEVGVKFDVLDRGDAIIFSVFTECKDENCNTKEAGEIKGSLKYLPRGFDAPEMIVSSAWLDRIFFLSFMVLAGFGIAELYGLLVQAWGGSMFEGTHKIIELFPSMRSIEPLLQYVGIGFLVLIMFAALLLLLMFAIILFESFKYVPRCVRQELEHTSGTLQFRPAMNIKR